MHRKWLCIPAALACLFAQAASARNIFLTSGEFATSRVSTFSTDPLAFGTDLGGISGAFKVLPSSSAEKYYAITRSGTETVTVLEGRFPILAVGRRIAIMSDATDAAVTPNRERLIVVGPSGVQIIDTATDQTLLSVGSLDVGTNPIDVATSLDSSRAYILTESRLTAIDLSTNQVAGSIPIGSAASNVSVGPNGVVYVSAQNAAYEIDGRAMTVRATFPVAGAPGELEFTPNGRFALARNEEEFSGSAAYLFDLGSRTVTERSTAGFGFRDIAVVDDSTAYGLATNGNIYIFNLGERSLTYSQASFQRGERLPPGESLPTNVRDIEVTNELPRAQYLVLTDGSRIYRVDLATNTLADMATTSFPGSLSIVAPPNRGGVANILTYNTTQTTPAGTTSLPLVMRVFDASGRPVSGVPVTFSTTTPGIPAATTTVDSNFEGIASTTVAVPASITTGSIVVNASAGGARSAQFTINIGDPGLPGGGTTPPLSTGLQVWLGQGQVISEHFPVNEPLTVKVTNAQGEPISGVQINWNLSQGQGNVNPQVSETNSEGIATTTFTASGVLPFQVYLLNTVTAAAPALNQEVTFFVLSLPTVGQIGAGLVTTQLLTPSTIQARAGEVLPDAIRAVVVSTRNGMPLPSVGMRVSSTGEESGFGPTAQCRNRFAFSNESGVVSCDLVVGPRTGTATLTVHLGSTSQYSIGLEVLPGEPSRVVITREYRRSGNVGEQSVLQVQVTDAGGNGLAGVPITWDRPANVRLISSDAVTDAFGLADATVEFPQTAGPFVVRARAGTGVATFNLSTNAVVSALNKVSGDNQSAVINQAFAQPVTVRVLNEQNEPLQGATVTFMATGPATVGSPSVTTGADGLASTTVTAGANPGGVTITATVGSASAIFNLQVRTPGPGFTASDIVNAAGFQPGISPGGMAYIRASGIAPGVQGSVTPSGPGPLPTQLSGVEVLFNNTAAPIYAVSNVNGDESVIVQVPFEIAPGTASVTIRTSNAGSTTLQGVQILPVKPGVFTFRDANGQVYASATRADGSYVTSANPARRGEQVTVYASGLGQTSPATGTNQVGVAGQTVLAPVIAGVNNAGIRVVSAGLVPGSVGLYYVTLEIPQDTAAGTNQPFGLAVESAGQLVFANGTAIPLI